MEERLDQGRCGAIWPHHAQDPATFAFEQDRDRTPGQAGRRNAGCIRVAIMGVGPLIAAAIAEMFDLRWQEMIQGLAFMIYQIGSFLGAYGGGLLYDALGSHTMAWRIGVALGLAGGTVQLRSRWSSHRSHRRGC